MPRRAGKLGNCGEVFNTLSVVITAEARRAPQAEAVFQNSDLSSILLLQEIEKFNWR